MVSTHGLTHGFDPWVKFQPELETVWPDAFQLPVEIKTHPCRAATQARSTCRAKSSNVKRQEPPPAVNKRPSLIPRLFQQFPHQGANVISLHSHYLPPRPPNFSVD